MRPVQILLAPVNAEGGWRELSVSTTVRGPNRILVVPGALVLSRDMTIPGRTDAQIRAAALAALAPDLAMPVEACVCGTGPARDGKRTAYVIARPVIDKLVAESRVRGFSPDLVIPDYALLPEPQGDEAVVAEGPECIVRIRGAGFGCQADLLPALLGQRQQRLVDFESSVRAAIQNGNAASLPNLLQATTKASRASEPNIPLFGILAMAAALAIYAGLPWIDVWRLNQSTAELRRETEKVAREALPTAQRIVNPLAQLREARMPATSATAGLNQATVMLEGLAASPGVAVSRLELADGAVRAQVGVASTSLLQPLRDHMAANGFQLQETPGPSQPNSIPVDLQLMPAP